MFGDPPSDNLCLDCGEAQDIPFFPKVLEPGKEDADGDHGR
jgi:hypothetical protein